MGVHRYLVVIGLLLVVPAARAGTAAGWNLAILMQSLAAVRSASGSFTQTKTIALLTAPLHSSGTLRYVAPDYLSQTVLAPSREDFVLQGGKVTFAADGQTHSFSLSQAPQLGALVEGVRATLAGDEAALASRYTIALSGGPADWQLLLRPKDPALKAILSWLSIRGKRRPRHGDRHRRRPWRSHENDGAGSRGPMRLSWLPVCLCLALALFCAAVAARSPYRTDMADFLPHAHSLPQQALDAQVSSGGASRILLVQIDGAPCAHTCSTQPHPRGSSPPRSGHHRRAERRRSRHGGGPGLRLAQSLSAQHRGDAGELHRSRAARRPRP